MPFLQLYLRSCCHPCCCTCPCSGLRAACLCPGPCSIPSTHFLRPPLPPSTCVSLTVLLCFATSFRSRAAAVCALTRLVTEDEAGASPISNMRTGAMAQQLIALRVPLNSRRASAATLWKAALVKDNRLAVIKSGGETGIVDLLALSLSRLTVSGNGTALSPQSATVSSSVAYATLCAACAQCIYQLVRTPQCRGAVVAAGAIPLLMRLLSPDTPRGGEPGPTVSGGGHSSMHSGGEGLRAAMHAVRGLAEDTDARKAILSAGGLSAVAAVLEGSMCAEARTSAAATLAALIDSRDVADFVLQGTALKCLLNMVSDGDRNEQVRAACSFHTTPFPQHDCVLARTL